MQIDPTLSLAFLAEFNAQTALKLLIVAIAYPLWGPIAKAMRHEITEALAPDGGLMGNQPKRTMEQPPPGLDPFLNVPLARHRRQAQAHQTARAAQGVLTPQARANPGPGSRRSQGTPSTARAHKRSSF